MWRLAFLVALIACDGVERLSLSSRCPDPHDRMDAKIEGVPLCARATLGASIFRPFDTRDSIGFPVIVDATLIAGDGTRWGVAVGIDEQGRVARRNPVSLAIRREHARESPDHGVAFARLFEGRRLELPHPPSWVARSGEVLFEHYDLTTGISKGAFDLRFEAGPDALGTTRTIRVHGTFETATPIVVDDS